MNFILLESEDFIDDERVRLTGRRFEHVRAVLRASAGEELRVGLLNGKIGRGRIENIHDDGLEMTVQLDREPPPPLALRLILALPRPKVLNRIVAAAASMGIREIDLINAWRVEKSYWASPRLSAENLRLQSILGLEQAGDTVLPTIRLHRLFKPFVHDELRIAVRGKEALLAHPGSAEEAPRGVTSPVVLAVGPDGGFIPREIESFQEIGFASVNLGPRILRMETAVAYLVGRLSP